jgi:excisionase family DNA binding protein
MKHLGSIKSTPTAFLTAQGSTPFFDNQLITYKEAAQYLGVSESYLRRLKSQGKMPWVPIGNRSVRFRVSSLNKWIEERECK